eukprot:gene8149-8342_t
MLDQLSPQHLQALYINDLVPDGTDSITEILQRLRRFTRVQLLHLKHGVKKEVLQSVLQSMLPTLTNLRALHVGSRYAVDLHQLVQWIPPTALLHELELSIMRGLSLYEVDHLTPLDMRHLSALTALRSLSLGLDIRDGDVLPPKLQEVAVRCTTLGPVSQLQHLLDLTLEPIEEEVSVLQQLSNRAFLGLTSLTGLRSLSLRGCPGVSDDVTAGFASSLQHLTMLDLEGTWVTAEGAMCLTSLCDLQQLDLPYYIR